MELLALARLLNRGAIGHLRSCRLAGRLVMAGGWEDVSVRSRVLLTALVRPELGKGMVKGFIDLS